MIAPQNRNIHADLFEARAHNNTNQNTAVGNRVNF